MSFSSQKRRRIKPFARPTSYDINCAYDIRHYQQTKYGNNVPGSSYFSSKNSDEGYQVLEGEVLMQLDAPQVRRYGDHQMHVFSFANGLSGKTKAEVLGNLKYAGVAVTGFTPESDVFEQGFVLTLGGLNTIFNNGTDPLFPGDVICASIPDPRGRKRSQQTGIPRDKIQFELTSFKKLAGEVGHSLASRFIMGTALSYARPSASVDIVLHKCNFTVVKTAGVNGQIFESNEASKSSAPSLKTKKKGKK